MNQKRIRRTDKQRLEDARQGSKVCTKCGVRKDMEEYHNLTRSPDGKNPVCRQCHNLRSEEYRKTEQGKAVRRRQTVRAYGLTIEDYEKMYKELAGCCQICGDHRDVLHIDHDHKTGKVRGLLCSSCNTGIGKLKDNTGILRGAINYLERNYE